MMSENHSPVAPATESDAGLQSSFRIPDFRQVLNPANKADPAVPHRTHGFWGRRVRQISSPRSPSRTVNPKPKDVHAGPFLLLMS